jgi:fructokinase
MHSTDRHHVTVIGEALIDLVPAGDELVFRARQGGSPLNVAVGLARLGVRTSIMARLSSTAFGRALRQYLAAESVDVSACPDTTLPATLAVVTLDESSDAVYDFYTQGTADWQWTPPELERIPPDTTVVHFGSIASWTQPGWRPVVERARRLHESARTLVSYDPNIRPVLCGERAEATFRVEQAVSCSHLVKVSEEDLAWLYPGVPAGGSAAEWLSLGPELVVVTKGPGGAVCYSSGGAEATSPGRAVRVTDTVGAGDSFTSALLVALMRSGYSSPGLLGETPAGDLAEALRFAIAASSVTCTRAGADPPRSADVAAVLAA